MKRATKALLRSCANYSIMIFHDLPAQGQTYTCATVIATDVKPCKQVKDLLRVIGFKPYAIVRELQVMVGSSNLAIR